MAMFNTKYGQICNEGYGQVYNEGYGHVKHMAVFYTKYGQIYKPNLPFCKFKHDEL